jgi:anti-sigma-K factor RskA
VTDDRDHVIAELTDYVLDALGESDQRRVSAHLDVCAPCTGRLREYEGVIAALPLALNPLAPPPEAWATIQGVVTRQRPRRRLHEGLTTRWSRVVQWSATATVAAALLIWNVVLQQQLSRYAEGPQVEKLARRPARLVILHGTTNRQLSARLFAAVDGRTGHMAVSGLRRLPAERVYQLWFLPRSGPAEGAATFTVDENGRAWVVVTVPRPLEETDALVVTEEGAPGSNVPTGERVLEATQWR